MRGGAPGEPRPAWVRSDHLLGGVSELEAAFLDLQQLEGAPRTPALRTQSGRQGREAVGGRGDSAGARAGPCASAPTAHGAAALRPGLAPVYLLHRLGGTRRASQPDSRAAPKHSVLSGCGLSVCLGASPITSKDPGSFFPYYPRLLLRTTPLPCTERLKKKAPKPHHAEVTRGPVPGLLAALPSLQV